MSHRDLIAVALVIFAAPFVAVLTLSLKAIHRHRKTQRRWHMETCMMDEQSFRDGQAAKRSPQESIKAGRAPQRALVRLVKFLE